MKWFSSALILVITFSETYAHKWDQTSAEGWLWYKEQAPEPIKKEESPQPESLKSPSKKKETYQAQLTKLREHFEEAMAKSILVPTLENVNETRALHDQMFHKSEQFSQLWMVSTLMDGRGHEATTNLNPLHRKIYEQDKTEKLSSQLKTLSKTYGLFFVFKPDCPYCHKFVPLVAEFANKFGFELKGISKDGGTLPGLTNISKDNGILNLINLEGIYPALFLANPKTLEVMPVAWGMVSYTELLQNFETLIQAMEIPHAHS